MLRCSTRSTVDKDFDAIPLCLGEKVQRATGIKLTDAEVFNVIGKLKIPASVTNHKELAVFHRRAEDALRAMYVPESTYAELNKHEGGVAQRVELTLHPTLGFQITLWWPTKVDIKIEAVDTGTLVIGTGTPPPPAKRGSKLSRALLDHLKTRDVEGNRLAPRITWLTPKEAREAESIVSDPDSAKRVALRETVARMLAVSTDVGVYPKFKQMVKDLLKDYVCLTLPDLKPHHIDAFTAALFRVWASFKLQNNILSNIV